MAKMQSSHADTREERIAAFNREADEIQQLRGDDSLCCPTTHDFTQKIRSGAKPSIRSLRPIQIAQLKVGTAHRGRAVFCRIVSGRVIVVKSAAVLVEDESEMTSLAVYGLADTRQLTEGRRMAVIEPFFKIRADGTKGIRVDDPDDIVFDIDGSSEPLETEAPPERLTAEARLQELLLADGTMGVNRLYQMLVDEGYTIGRKQVRAQKATFAREKTGSEKTNPLIPILSERQPHKHRVLRVPRVLAYREAGNKAYDSGNFKEAEQYYTEALRHKDDKYGEGTEEDNRKVEGVCLWQLYGNRSAARLRLGMLDEAFQDSLTSNICAPTDVVKPLLRCAEALVALGLRNEAIDLLDATAEEFPCDRDNIRRKKQLLEPNSTLRVGKEHEFSTIESAIRAAPPGAEILVDAGVYKEPLFLLKPVTIRSSAATHDFAAISAVEGGGKDSVWSEIRVDGQSAVFCDAGSASPPVRIIGFNIICSGPSYTPFHAVHTRSGVVVLRNCILTSSGGPVVAAVNYAARVIMQACAVHSGTQGGILATTKATLSLKQVHCCRHAASGLELRDGGSAVVDGSHFYSNGQQGIMVWKSAGQLTAKDCTVHSNAHESGVLVSEAEAFIEHCRVYGNAAAGIVAQRKGSIFVFKCEVHDNHDGILIQDTSSARVEHCDVFSNRAIGIFVGFDHRGAAAITDNKVHDNASKGVFIGNSGNVVARGNDEYGNRGLPPPLSKGAKGLESFRSSKYLKSIKKNQSTIKKAMREQEPCSFLDSLVQQQTEKMGGAAEFLLHLNQSLLSCAFCNTPPAEGKAFAKCARCKSVSYCSKKCQKVHWPQHKANCQPKPVKYPTFLDPQQSV